MSDPVALGLALYCLLLAVVVLFFMGADDPREDETVDDTPEPDAFDEWLDALPVECLSDAEVARRAARLDFYA